jgi:hypothetical protein
MLCKCLYFLATCVLVQPTIYGYIFAKGSGFCPNPK